MATANTSTKKKPEETIDPETGEVLNENLPATTSTNALSNPADNFDYGQDAGAGLENITGDDVAIPFLVLLQPGSPEVQGEEATARAGMWINKTTGELFSGKEGITFVPAHKESKMVEWVPRDSGGGLVDQHPIDGELARRCRSEQPLGTYKHPDFFRPGLSEEELKKINDIVETHYVYGVLINSEGVGQPAVIAFSSTHIKPYQQWMYRVRSIVIPLPNGGKLTSRQMPLWAFSYNLTTQRVERNNQTWYIPVVNFAAPTAMDSRVPPGTELYELAKAVYEGVTSGTKKAATDTLSRSEGATDAMPRAGSRETEEAPY